MRRAVWGLLAWASTAHAEPTTFTGEAGAEADTNVQRVETGPTSTPRIGAAALRIGGKLVHRARGLGGGFALQTSALARIVEDDRITTENVALLAGDVRWLHPIGERPIAAGFGASAVDALSLAGTIGARTFRNLAAEGMLMLRDGDHRTLSLAVGGRHFTYKPDHDFDWTGPTASVRLELTLWEPSSGTRSVELSGMLAIEARAYAGQALANACAPGAPPSPDCFAGTSLSRRDRHHRAGVEVTWTGPVVAALGYQLTVTDSNSFGQSLVRHRVNASVTTDLPWKLYGTAFATLQIDRYLDGLIVEQDLQHQEFTSLDDENRSSLQLRLARDVSETWSIETRAAVWRDYGGVMDTAFRRALLYAGLVFSR